MGKEGIGDRGQISSQSNNAGQEDSIDEGEDNSVIGNPCDPGQTQSNEDELHEKNRAPKLCDKETNNAEKKGDSSSSSDKTDCEKMGSKRTDDAATLNVADGETFQSSSADQGILTTFFWINTFRSKTFGICNYQTRGHVSKGTSDKKRK